MNHKTFYYFLDFLPIPYVANLQTITIPSASIISIDHNFTSFRNKSSVNNMEAISWHKKLASALVKIYFYANLRHIFLSLAIQYHINVVTYLKPVHFFHPDNAWRHPYLAFPHTLKHVMSL